MSLIELSKEIRTLLMADVFCIKLLQKINFGRKQTFQLK